MRVSSLNVLATGGAELGVVYASVEGVNENSYEECLEQLIHKAAAIGARPWSRRNWCKTSFSGTSAPAFWQWQ